jgi:hypothetical protein
MRSSPGEELGRERKDLSNNRWTFSSSMLRSKLLQSWKKDLSITSRRGVVEGLELKIGAQAREIIEQISFRSEIGGEDVVGCKKEMEIGEGGGNRERR